MPAESPDRAPRTRKFQLVNDAYYTLSDAGRRREYDAQRKLFGGRYNKDPFGEPDDHAEPAAGGSAQSGYSWAWNHFTGQGAGGRERAENAQFEDVFEEMMRDEGLADPQTNRPTGAFWSIVGGISGGALGFIVANVPGLLAGAVAGNRLGAIRDARGKSVYAVFQVGFPQSRKSLCWCQVLIPCSTARRNFRPTTAPACSPSWPPASSARRSAYRIPRSWYGAWSADGPSYAIGPLPQPWWLPPPPPILGSS